MKTKEKYNYIIYFTRIAKTINEKKINILELGCGNGSLCKKLSDLGYTGNYIGVDISDKYNLSKVKNINHTFFKITPPH